MDVLVAENDQASQLILNICLERWGYGTTCVDNGKDAWKVLQRENPPPIAILDWMMPQMSGLDVCQLVRQRPAGRAYTYIILLTAKG